MNTGNRFFSLLRFMYALRRFACLNRRQLLLSAMSVPVAMMVASAVLGLLWQTIEPLELIAWEEIIYTLIFALTGCYVASWMFSDFTSPLRAQTALTLPETVGEAFAVRWFVAVPLFCLLGAASVLIADEARIAVSLFAGAPDDLLDPMYEILAGESEISLDSDVISLPLFLMLQSFFLLGSAVWRGNSFLKTMGALWLIAIVYFVAGQAAFGAFLAVGAFNADPGSVFVSRPVLAIMTVVALYNYLITWLRLREADLASRW